MTAVPYYTDPNPAFPIQFFRNGPEVIKLFEGHHVTGVLQGHTHVKRAGGLAWGAVCHVGGGVRKLVEGYAVGDAGGVYGGDGGGREDVDAV